VTERLGATLAICCALIIGMHGIAGAQSILERLVTPGPLIEGHAKLERSCNDCHAPFSRQSQSALCLDCHKEIAADRRSIKRLHGREPNTVTQECKLCHTDHKGRSADVLQLDRDTIDHAFTNFELKGAHATVRCDGCHVKPAKFREAPVTCIGCHKASDPHKGRLGEHCADCHTEDTWLRVKPYDHDKTKFKLDGAHKDVACAGCHTGELYKDLGTGCVACHRLQDVHATRYGAKCETCHDLQKWKTIHFDHDKDTKYPLRGKHPKVECDLCHTGKLYGVKLATTCLSCHKDDDVHKNQLGGRCEQCHDETDWHKKVTFNHDVSRLPLIGRHAIVPCEECHASQSFKKTSLVCGECHKDTVHEGRLGPNCGSCHNPNGWTRWRFNHTTQTKYQLTGKHEDLSCEACHTDRKPTKLTLPTACTACHNRDDAHQGSFGRSCDRCHGTESFRKLVIRR
jgi:hypothetical protein